MGTPAGRRTDGDLSDQRYGPRRGRAAPGGTFGTVTTPGSRVVSVTLDDGTPIIAGGAVVAGAPTVSIVTNSFTAAGGDNYAALGSIPADRKVNLGLTYEQALADYVLSFPVAEGLPTIPASDARYANPTARAASPSPPDMHPDP